MQDISLLNQQLIASTVSATTEATFITLYCDRSNTIIGFEFGVQAMEQAKDEHDYWMVRGQCQQKAKSFMFSKHVSPLNDVLKILASGKLY